MYTMKQCRQNKCLHKLCTGQPSERAQSMMLAFMRAKFVCALARSAARLLAKMTTVCFRLHYTATIIHRIFIMFLLSTQISFYIAHTLAKYLIIINTINLIRIESLKGRERESKHTYIYNALLFAKSKVYSVA